MSTVEDKFLITLKILDEDKKESYKDGLPTDEEVAKKAEDIMKEVDAKYGTIIAESKVDFNGLKDKEAAEGKFANGNRDGETNTGDFVTDAMKWYVMKDGADLGVPNENIVTILNGGSKKSYTIKKLSSGKRYYVKIIPYKNKGGNKYIGQYRIKSVKAK